MNQTSKFRDLVRKSMSTSYTNKPPVALAPIKFNINPANVRMLLNFQEKKYARGGGVRKVRY